MKRFWISKRSRPLLVIGLVILGVSLACGTVGVGIEAPIIASLTATVLPNDQHTEPPIPLVSPETSLNSTPTALPPDEVASRASLLVGYLKNGDVWLWKDDGTIQQLTSQGDALDLRLSDDGEAVAYLRRVSEFHQELWAINSDASGLRRLVSAADLDALEPTNPNPDAKAIIPNRFEWVPGSHTLAYNTRYSFEALGLVLLDDLRLVEGDTLEQSTLLSAGEGGEFYYSPNGRWVALVTPTQINLAKADGSDLYEALLIYPEVSTYSEYRYYARPTWSPDSLSMRVAIPPAEPLNIPTEPTRLYAIPNDGTPALEIGQITTELVLGFEIAFSPDIAHIAYVTKAGSEEEIRRQLHVALSDGSNDQIYIEESLVQFYGWSLDSKRFLFTFGDPVQVQIGELEDGWSPLPGENAPIFNLRWVDGERFLYLKENRGAFELRLMDINNGDILVDTLPSPVTSYDFAN